MASRQARSRSVIGPLESLEGRQLLARAVGLDLGELLAQLVPAETAKPTGYTASQVEEAKTAATSTIEAASRAVSDATHQLISALSTAANLDQPNYPPAYAAAKAAAASSRVTGGPVANLRGRVDGGLTATPGTIILGQGTGALTNLGRTTVTGTVDYWNGKGQIVVVGSGNRAFLLDVTHVDYLPQRVSLHGGGVFRYRLGTGYGMADSTIAGPASGQVLITVRLTRAPDGNYQGRYFAQFSPGPG